MARFPGSGTSPPPTSVTSLISGVPEASDEVETILDNLVPRPRAAPRASEGQRRRASAAPGTCRTEPS